MGTQAKPRFSDLLVAALRERGVTQEKAATIARIPPATFRTKVGRNTFAKREAEAVMDAIGMRPPSQRSTDFGKRWEVRGPRFEGMSLAEAVREVDRQRKIVDEHLDRIAGCLPYLVRAMGEGDVAVSSSSTVTSVEMERDAGEELTTAVAQAVKNGAAFVYIRPDRVFLESFGDTWRFTRVPGFREVEQEAEWFRERLAAILAKRNGVASAEAGRMVRERVIQVYARESPFWAAGFCFGLLQTTDLGGGVLRRVTVRMPGPHRRAVIQPADYDLFAARFTSFAIRALRKAGEFGEVTAGSQAAIDRVLAVLEKGGAYE